MTTVCDVRDEADLQRRVAGLATRGYGLLHYHTHDSRRSESGFPDSVFVGRRVLFRELKLTRRSRVSSAQRQWLARLGNAGADAGIWYAEDWHSGLIDSQLRDAAPRQSMPQRRHDQQPALLERVAKRLYLDEQDNQTRAALLWEAGVASVHADRWRALARHTLTIVAAELPATTDELTGWLREHGAEKAATLTASEIFTFLTTDLTGGPGPATAPEGARP